MTGSALDRIRRGISEWRGAGKGYVLVRLADAEALLDALEAAEERTRQAEAPHEHQFEDCCVICGIHALDYFR